MKNVSLYDKLTLGELREELVIVTSILTVEYESLGMNLADYHRDYLNDYAQAAESSAVAKNRIAAYANQEMGHEIIIARAKINSLILARDLLVFLLLAREPGPAPFPNVTHDDDGLPVF